jgi:hypothetical protein
MKRTTRIGEQSIALFLLGMLAFNSPLLRIFGAEGEIFGYPLFFVFAFAVWAFLILMMALIASRGKRTPKERDEPEGAD